MFADKDADSLERFVDAQENVMEQVFRELRSGRKETHWMWFVFPQLRGLGHSPMATRYGIASRKEAEQYLQHPVLGPRLRECTGLVNQVEGRTASQIFGFPDDMKFHSSVTLFAHATQDNDVFKFALSRYFGGEFDPATVQRLR